MDSYLSNMISHWHSLKKVENQFHEERIKTEEAIQSHLQKHNLWINSGTMSFNDLKIRVSYNRKWNQKSLAKIKAQNQLEQTQFPFLTEYKELKTQSDYLEAKEPDVWKKLAPALLVFPAKPYFFVPRKGE
jgi:hypothetical protein